jgi:ParB-like chromosome segregation protein Spo0J
MDPKMKEGFVGPGSSPDEYVAAGADENGLPDNAPQDRRSLGSTSTFHPVSELFPLMEGPDFEALVADIREHGLQEPVVRHPDGSILDGRNRFLACQRLGLPCPQVDWTGEPGTEIQYVVSANMRRRHLTAGQRAMIATGIAKLPQGVRQIGTRADEPTQAQAAGMLAVSTRAVGLAAKIQDEAPPEAVEAVKNGEMSLREAARKIPQKPLEERRARKGKRLPTRVPKRDTMEGESARNWIQMGTALDTICGLPSPEDVVRGCQSPQGKQKAALKAGRAITWLSAMLNILTAAERSAATPAESGPNASNEDPEDRPADPPSQGRAS